jgi:hypothetical protein
MMLMQRRRRRHRRRVMMGTMGAVPNARMRYMQPLQPF